MPALETLSLAMPALDTFFLAMPALDTFALARSALNTLFLASPLSQPEPTMPALDTLSLTPPLSQPEPIVPAINTLSLTPPLSQPEPIVPALDTLSLAPPLSQRLLDKVAVITGASSGLGRAIALAFSAHGAAVVCADLQPVAQVHVKEDDVKATHEIIIEGGRRGLFVECDVSHSQSIQDLCAKTVEVYGRLDVMVNNAGIAIETRKNLPIHETAESTFDTTMSVNSRGVFLGCKYAAQQMIAQDPHPSGDRGWIINTASVAGLVGVAKSVAYAASKGAVVQMTRTAALDLAPLRIHCNALCPGFIKTAMLKPSTDVPRKNDRLAERHPFKGLGEPEDIAKVAVFLASEDASWVSGVALPVDGCYTAQ